MKTEEENIDWTANEDVTGDELMSTPGLEYLTKAQAEEAAHFIRIFSMLLFTIMEKQMEEEQGAKIIPLYKNEEIKRAA